MIGAGEIADDLRRLGLSPGATVLVHSSLRRIGRVDGGAAAVVAALESVLGAEGTLVVPTFTGGPDLTPASPPHFRPERDPGWTGAVAETVRQRPAALRSLGATHSVAAIGRRARAVTAGHLDSVSPCDAASPFARVADREDGYVLLLGVDHESNTMLHHVEELVGTCYHLQDRPARVRISVGGTTVHRQLLLHRYGTPRHFMVLDDLLGERGIQRTGRVGDTPARLVRARALVALASAALRATPRLFVGAPA